MSFLPEELKRQVFPCPHCNEYLSTDVDKCRFCDAEVTQDMKSAAVEKEINQMRLHSLNSHKNSLILGVVLLIVGFWQFISPLLSARVGEINVSCLGPILIIAGAVLIATNLSGYFREKNRK